MNEDKTKRLTYKDAGVNIETGEDAVNRIKDLVKTTYQPGVLTGLGLFGSLLRLNDIAPGYKDPVIVQSIDGVGTKSIIARQTRSLDTIGIDLVNHCGNDIVTLGAKPKTLLDYIGCEVLGPERVESIISGMALACKAMGCSLVGGEMAEMPDIYRTEEYDLVGCMLGLVEYDQIIDGSNIKPGDQIIGLASAGVHTNGLSLVRKIIAASSIDLGAEVAGLETTLGHELTKPHRSYVNPILRLLADGIEVHGISHITGGGIAGNLVRILPENCQAVIHTGRWKIPPIFSFLQSKGNVDLAEMFRVFNMGLGMLVVVPGWKAGKAAQRLEWHLHAQEKGGAGDLVFQVGDIEPGPRKVCLVD